ncbi:MAG TPA: hypothetical protein VFJ58_15660 [Armatimonadota bacterium]|nr:hypothetical protein [Armatimonadota bacterium]
MPHSADLGSKRLIGLAPQSWVEWLFNRSDIEVGPIITSDFQWVGREGDVLIQVHSPDAGTFLVANEINLRYSNLMPRRTRAYAALAEEKFQLPVYPIVVYILPPPEGMVAEDRYESEVLGLKALQEYRVINLWDMEASVVLETPLPTLLPFVPIMRGGENESMIREALHKLRADETLREMEPLLAFFASFVLETDVVRQIMRWDMLVLEKSPWYNEILARGAAQGKQEAIAEVLNARFGIVSEEIMTAVRKIRDMDRLHALNTKAAVAASLEEFVEELNHPHPSD